MYLRALLPTVLALHSLSLAQAQSSGSCACSGGIVPVDVDVLVPLNASDPFAGFNSSSESKRRIRNTYGINTILCEPRTDRFQGVVQLLVHGFTYNSQYWTMPTTSFQNYSYVDFACERGLTSVIYDSLGTGLSERPPNASDVQIPVIAQIASRMAAELKAKSSIGSLSFKSQQPFRTVIGVGHSLGSVTLNVAAIQDGRHSPFDGLILTSNIHLSFLTTPTLPPARDIDPTRWADLDPNYVATAVGVRPIFYSSDTTSYSPRILALDELTKDVGSAFTGNQLPSSFFPATGYLGPVSYMLGNMDAIFCANSSCDGTANQTLIIDNERKFWPNALDITLFVAVGIGHDLNFHFNAGGVFEKMLAYVGGFLR